MPSPARQPQAQAATAATAPASTRPDDTQASAALPGQPVMPAAAHTAPDAAASDLAQAIANAPAPHGGAAAATAPDDAPDTPDTRSADDAPNPFAALGLAPELLDAVRALGFTQPTAVQQRAIPLALAAPQDAAQQPGPAGGQRHHGFNDLLVSSQTGSGKTAAFLLPVLHTLIAMQREAAAQEKAAWQAQVDAALAAGAAPPRKPRRKNPLDPRHFKPATPGALVLCPTRELAQQVAQDAIDLVRHCQGLRIANIVGGMPYQVQVARLQNANLVVATPGRLLDLHRGGQIKLAQVRFLVVDEADRMLDLGFADDLAEVNHLTAARQQTMMFSATFAPRIQQLAMRVMHDGGARVQRIEVATPQQRHAHITQSLHWADSPEHKRRLLDHLLRDASIDQAIVFACTQIECEQLAEELQQAGFAAASLHGALSQALRNRRLKALRDGRIQILVATDVAARGIDVPSITHVINFGLPMKAEDYTHRIGRTGRAGREGLAITLAEIRDRRRLADIEAHTRQPWRVHQIEGLEPTRHFPPITAALPAGKGGKWGQSGKGAKGGQPWAKGGKPAHRASLPPRHGDSRGPRIIGPGHNSGKHRGREWDSGGQFTPPHSAPLANAFDGRPAPAARFNRAEPSAPRQPRPAGAQRGRQGDHPGAHPGGYPGHQQGGHFRSQPDGRPPHHAPRPAHTGSRNGWSEPGSRPPRPTPRSGWDRQGGSQDSRHAPYAANPYARARDSRPAPPPATGFGPRKPHAIKAAGHPGHPARPSPAPGPARPARAWGNAAGATSAGRPYKARSR